MRTNLTFLFLSSSSFSSSGLNSRTSENSSSSNSNQSNRLFLTLLAVLSLFTVATTAEECGHEELVQCAKPLQVISATSELSFVTNKKELEQICP